MSFQQSLGALGASIAGLIGASLKISKPEKKDDTSQAKLDYYKASANLKNLKAEDLKLKLEQRQQKLNMSGANKAFQNSMQEVNKKLDNINLIIKKLNEVSADKKPLINTSGTDTNITSSEDIKALEAKQQREWKAHVNRSNAAKKVWDVKNSIRNLEDVDNQWEFSGNFKVEDLKKIGLNKTKLREMDKGGEFEKAQAALADHFKGTETETAILGAQNHAELGKIIENEIYRAKTRKAEEDAYWESKFAEEENPVEAVQNKQEVKEETYSVWPKRNFNINIEEKKDFSETRNWRQ